MAIHDFPLSRTTSEANNLDALIREIYLLQQAGAVTCETSVTGLVDLISISNPALVPSLLRIIQDQDISISEENDVSQPTLDEPLTTTPAFITLENAVGLDREASPGLADYAASPVESSRSQGEDCDDHAPATSVERSSNASIGMEMVEVDALLDNENEKRTTVMIKKIPRRFTVAALRDLIERECPALRHGGYDLLYLPVDTAKVANRGYAFINFTTPRYLLVFTLAFQGYEWFPQRRRRSEGTTNTKACEIYFAHIQGRDATIRSVDPTGSKRSNSPNYESIGDGKSRLKIEPV
ncbi:hypothetical protein Pmar_PMAR020410 [Perkinsus marinus ATCC 50983]|uniref:Mei2-like C-terminal RNA recognition motif domain-containing protein n=1 Tax=Perkinsus marinus (strain ATCC 50983 / TXsc) TaxID=423536 RepID=C5L6Y9_PERM5|nr:hypothetical protein Pmar_PMAR020410 [Perkinsus marinus ATCC 50983]EER07251.1 hypothetical protein Pmar_PMAR020410 [Perkinsus marinus ATCC 50983]|eukprot:XP_002775435.1 hypothetical protein Pmar_PMAR020410 [Perkinsus marinus ATCC 50983]